MTPRGTELLARLAARQRGPSRYAEPVGVIGPGDGGTAECAAAYQVGKALALAGMAVVCGGRGGVMQAASHGASAAGGVVIGILPEEDLRAANRHLTVGIATGMGEMRNALIARSSVCLVAIGGGMGTLSEMALGLKWGKTVYTLYEDAQLTGARSAHDADQLIEWVLEFLVEGAAA